MTLYSANFTNDAYYPDAINMNSNFYSEFQREGSRKYVCIENYKIFFKEPPVSSKTTCFEKWLKESFTLDLPFKYKLEKVETRLSNKKIENRKNADLREFILFKNYFMVKKFFSFGLQTVPENAYHIITTTVKPLDLFIPKYKLDFTNNFFDGKREYLFTKHIVDAHQTYLFRPGDQYLLVTTSKCVFYFTEIKQELLYITQEQLMEKIEESLHERENPEVSVQYANGLDLSQHYELITP